MRIFILLSLFLFSLFPNNSDGYGDAEEAYPYWGEYLN